ncbi:hypothetical protein C0992_005702 [Termitomyces sp. T32_za158]|nr:hypothetical protein C0992_005702 [Termitomyces sp. T32_za158]
MATSRLFVDPAYLQRVEDDEFAKLKATTAYALKKVFPELELQIVPDAGHSAREPGIAKLLVEVRPN